MTTTALPSRPAVRPPTSETASTPSLSRAPGRRPAQDRPVLRGNPRKARAPTCRATNLLNVANGACTKLAEQLASPGLVLPWLLAAIGAPAGLVGFLAPIKQVGSLLPQLAVAAQIRRLARRKAAWVAAGIIQAGALALMVPAAALLSPVAAGLAVVVLLAVFSTASGMGSVAFQDVTGQDDPEGPARPDARQPGDDRRPSDAGRRRLAALRPGGGAERRSLSLAARHRCRAVGRGRPAVRPDRGGAGGDRGRQERARPGEAGRGAGPGGAGLSQVPDRPRAPGPGRGGHAVLCPALRTNCSAARRRRWASTSWRSAWRTWCRARSGASSPICRRAGPWRCRRRSLRRPPRSRSASGCCRRAGRRRGPMPSCSSSWASRSAACGWGARPILSTARRRTERPLYVAFGNTAIGVVTLAAGGLGILAQVTSIELVIGVLLALGAVGAVVSLAMPEGRPDGRSDRHGHGRVIRAWEDAHPTVF